MPLQRFEAWFARVVHNVAINYWHARYGTDGERTYVPVEEINEPEDARQEAAIKEILAEHDMEAILNRTPGLQYHERASLKLICFYGFSYPHLANIFGVPQGTVRSWISRALDKVHGQRGKA